jgi:hypothetical protein
MKVLVGDLVKVAAQHLCITPAEVRGRQRHNIYARARQAVSLVAFEAGRGYSEIGRGLQIDHTSVIYAVRKARILLDRDDKSFCRLVEALRTLKPAKIEAAPIVVLPTITKQMDQGFADQVSRHRGSILLAQAIMQARAA